MADVKEIEAACYRKRVFELWEYVCLKGFGISADRMHFYLCLECQDVRSSMALLVEHFKSKHQIEITDTIKTGRNPADEYMQLEVEARCDGNYFNDKHVSLVKRQDFNFRMLNLLEPSPEIISKSKVKRSSKKNLIENVVAMERTKGRLEEQVCRLKKMCRLERQRQIRCGGSKNDGEAEVLAKELSLTRRERERATETQEQDRQNEERQNEEKDAIELKAEEQNRQNEEEDATETEEQDRQNEEKDLKESRNSVTDLSQKLKTLNFAVPKKGRSGAACPGQNVRVTRAALALIAQQQQSSDKVLREVKNQVEAPEDQLNKRSKTTMFEERVVTERQLSKSKRKKGTET